MPYILRHLRVSNSQGLCHQFYSKSLVVFCYRNNSVWSNSHYNNPHHFLYGMTLTTKYRLSTPS